MTYCQTPDARQWHSRTVSVAFDLPPSHSRRTKPRESSEEPGPGPRTSVASARAATATSNPRPHTHHAPREAT
eukprot:scaffold35053_cov101-Isochrysis_galbana.AAC.1